jgi:Spy/CpxP family protein refolding chaperone
MKKLILVITTASSVLLFTNATNAQNAPNVAQSDKPMHQNKKAKLTPEERAQRSVDQLDKIVGLNPDQKNKIYNLALERSKSVDAVLQKYKGQPDKKEIAKQEIHQIRQKYRQDVKNILTPEQLEKLKQHHKARQSYDGKPEELIPDEKNEQ